ncbi:uncharacterized protein CcaverHIS019_0302090 [Cutaneotrichosporon cavernicola]|uniref:NADP-dependent oxidoreductase domain-containing protein n=1 Tax=Cutaneotrichosporon cavernicola TaxID=279322 RepID=A0AA48KZ65_9TREE|nr:uncharacterized protein CcaverHIS019_0302090 [Cutaneotrichosporon cavernicola]BEI90139.1 hypothetical protein CcaverHIS019_0302090 [Cutaneotrichosporon cavernicola]BEI97917.1 hypothetical protein CcaverHIS631_0302160 [Cutaneotrichosporon cavernicola]BEJ05696.1 hypothetical protein CcaverHIS641_0302180 [Cutaneotrichosporon cavernicola]
MLPSNHPYNPEEVLPPTPLPLPEEVADVIPPSEVLPPPIPNSALDVTLPRIVLGCAPFGYGVYADRDAVRTTMPARIVRAALRAGMTAFDTAPHYHPSEIILGHSLAALRDEYPRESYAIITKAGKYGPHVADHDYSPKVIKASVERSLRRLQTLYLDVVYLHDVEFVADAPPAQGTHLDALGDGAAEYHLTSLEPLGAGDQVVLAALDALRDLQSEGKIRAIGIAGYPLPTMLRLCRLAQAAGHPVDVVQSYAHQTVLCSTLASFLPAFEAAGVKQVVNAAPLAMGILTAHGGPEWHPAKYVPAVYDATRAAVRLAKEMGSTIEDVACAFGYRPLNMANGAVVPVVIGCTDLKQLHMTLKSYAEVNGGQVSEATLEAEDAVVKLFEERGVHNVSWQSPAPKDL